MGSGLRDMNFDDTADARQLRSREALAKALLDLIVEKNFDDITIREITSRANIGYATFFRHFQSKQELLGAVAYGEISNLLQQAVPLLWSKASLESCVALCEQVERNRPLWQALLTGGAASIVRECFLEQANALAGKNFDEQNDAPVPVPLAVRYGTAATIDMLSWWLGEGGQYSASQMGKYLDTLVIAPLTGAND